MGGWGWHLNTIYKQWDALMTKINNKDCAIAKLTSSKIAYVCTIHGKKSSVALKNWDILYKNIFSYGIEYDILDIALFSVKYGKNYTILLGAVRCQSISCDVCYSSRGELGWIGFFFFVSQPALLRLSHFHNVFAFPLPRFSLAGPSQDPPTPHILFVRIKRSLDMCKTIAFSISFHLCSKWKVEKWAELGGKCRVPGYQGGRMAVHPPPTACNKINLTKRIEWKANMRQIKSKQAWRFFSFFASSPASCMSCF